MARVSILMNGYNSEEYLKEAIDSIYGQSFRDWEIIFIDNCSTDKTAEIAKGYDKRLKYYKTDRNIPLGEARNFGLKYCSGEYLAFLDTDDIWLEDKLQSQIDILDRDRGLQMCYGGAIWIDERGEEIDRDVPEAKSGNLLSQNLIRYEINMQTVLIRADIDISFNTSMEFSPDYELFMGIVSRYRVAVIGKPLVKYRKLSNSLTSKKIDRWGVEMEETLNTIFKNDPTLKERYPKEYSLAYAKVGYYYAQLHISRGDIKKARLALSKYRFINLRYLTLYTLTFFPIELWKYIHRFK